MPPWRTVYGWFRRWQSLGLFERMMRDLARLRRRAVGRRPQPRLAIIDTQTVKYLPVRGLRGYDAGKRVVGRKRVALADAEGHWLAVAVVPAYEMHCQEHGPHPLRVRREGLPCHHQGSRP
jgi:hypothetical protein